MISDDDVKVACEELSDAPFVVCTGVGKSGEVASLVASLWRSVGLPAYYEHATDFLHGGLNAFLHTDELTPIIVMFSHSGRTGELVHLTGHINDHVHGVDLWIVTGDEDAGNDLKVDRTFAYEIERDGSVHGTIPYFSLVEQLSFGARVASTLADDLPAEDLLSGHPAGRLAYAYRREILDGGHR